MAQRNPPVEVTTRGAYWQALVCTGDHNARHSCPCLLLLDGQWPTLIASNRGLQRHFFVKFADCMLMPRSINGISRSRPRNPATARRTVAFVQGAESGVGESNRLRVL